MHTADNGTTLPGRLARAAGSRPVGDEAVDEAYVGVEASLALFREAFGRSSYDGQGAPVVATVHYGRDYDNAFWDGRQLVFGDGDGKVFERFTKPVDVLGHELAHAVTEHTAGPGVLRAVRCAQRVDVRRVRVLPQAAAARPGRGGRRLADRRGDLPARDQRAGACGRWPSPGTAYDDPVLGKDPQVGSMDAYVTTSQDNGGVHLNSGIANRAFYLSATGIGGASWEAPGRIWYAALTSGIGPRTDFAGFAAATLTAARAVSPAAEAAVRSGWEAVGVVPAAAGLPAGPAGRAAGRPPGRRGTPPRRRRRWR